MHIRSFWMNMKRWKRKKELSNGFHYATCKLLRFMMYSRPDKKKKNENNDEQPDAKEDDATEALFDEIKRSWYMDFLYVCSKSVRNITMLSYVDPTFYIKLENYIDSLEASKNRGCYGDIKELLVTEEALQFRKQRIEIDDGYFAQDEEAVGIEIPLRGYQSELTQFANEGTSVVICAPTGSGKTRVAIDIIEKHLDRRKANGQHSRVVFIVPTVPLVDQQCKQITTILSSKYSIVGISGGSHRDMNTDAFKILNAHIVVSTPQMLVNMLESLDKNRRLYISDFTLFVLDECHHCGQSHPYEVLMQKVRKHVGSIDENKYVGEKPQVVGLTASIGTRKGTNWEAVKDHILELCVKMLATQISTVRNPKNLNELYSLVNPPEDEIISAKYLKDDAFNNMICQLIEQVIIEIRPDIETAKATIDKLKTFNMDVKPSDPNFSNNFVQRLIEALVNWKGSLREERMRILYAIKHLRIYCFAMLFNNLLPSRFACAYMFRNFEELLKGVDKNELLLRLFEDNKNGLEEAAKSSDWTRNEILKKLVEEVLVKAYEAKRDTRAMIFVQRRQLAHDMADFLNRCRALEGFKEDKDWGIARSYVTSNAGKKEGGMSNTEQRATLRAFASGALKILVVTSIAEEGLDITACNLIVKYNTVGSERTMIQRRGRARDKASKSVLLCLDGELERKEIENIGRERLLKECLEDLQAKSTKQLATLIEEKRQKMLEIEMRNKKVEDLSRQLLEKVEFNLLCKACHSRLCSSNDIRSILDSHFCCVNENVWKDLEILPGEALSHAISVAGNVVRYNDIFLPSFKHLALAIQQVKNGYNPQPHDDKIEDNLTWSQMKKKFLVDPIGFRDMINMATALRDHNSSDFERVKAEAIHALQQKIQKIKEKKARKIKHNLAEYGEDD
ncbi:Type III restriction enzyme [Aphelenchoides bicaudatus]|nr:Type III restriction enzyme [Aphelenchoides bicaudatus]